MRAGCESCVSADQREAFSDRKRALGSLSNNCRMSLEASVFDLQRKDLLALPHLFLTLTP